ncbi:ABC transporter ATP-binding protein [Vibrio cholerae]|uniref:ABC transporter ATP-binding protein n=1 Tax=Vibrio cholerae TaxID=666 RepID=UPI0004E2C116|nr:ABC transporter ATP-binding protein [Vibrio cholerae]EGQ9391358.1 ABC transporter ATP-binding protein [Vibrio cholerae]EGR0539794.1 ABC transporter ATP-binding protein [Vibrio cholerae]EGR2311249.1 ABC transporter ATP-binding protein [Vibrio cholerae]EGR2460818.1 ABC transporter ATP-binding protein [Vibrio cholerae]EGR3989884.1 ABC transporter ATP-binding protein [Vibrio cholerae]
MKSIKIKNLCIEYPLFDASNTSLKSTLIKFIQRKHQKEKVHCAIDNLNIEIFNGDRVCLIGSNGAGKSTLLKSIAGILYPSKGEIIINGQLSTLLDFATGFEMEMTGYDNILIRGLLLGMSLEEISSKRHDIAEFADLGDFINQPLKTYSSGMFVRLAFAVATSIQPDVLVIDEIVGAGDASFAEKANKRMMNMLDKGNIIIMATHSPELAMKICNRGIWLDKGKVIMDGPIDIVLNKYLHG